MSYKVIPDLDPSSRGHPFGRVEEPAAACGSINLVGPAAATCSATPYFTVSPVALSDIERIVVVGGLGAPGYTLPTAHAGFYLATEGAAVRAPGPIQIIGLGRARPRGPVACRRRWG